MPDTPRDPTSMEVRHLRRDTRSALELAIVAFAPSEIVEPLALVTGMLEALAELPSDSAPALALTAATTERGRGALRAWRDWEATHKKLA